MHARTRLGHALIAACLFLLASATVAFAQATLTSDRADYAIGETVILTGTGWTPGETVTLVISELPAVDDPVVYTCTADAGGAIENHDFLAHRHGDTITFLVDALGATSGLTAQASFTDSPVVVSCSVSPVGSSSVPQGGSVTFTVSVYAYYYLGRTVGLSTTFTPSWPSGVGTNYNPPSLSTTCMFWCPPATLTSTLTMSTASYTPPGYYTFRVRAQYASGDYAEGWANITVQNSNRPPELAAIGQKYAYEGALLTFTATATDPDPGQTLRFALGGQPTTGMAIDPVTGVFTWTPDFWQGGNHGGEYRDYSIVVRVTDNAQYPLSDSEVVVVRCSNTNRPPSVSVMSEAWLSEEAAATISVDANDPDSDQSFYYSVTSGPPGLHWRYTNPTSSHNYLEWTPTEYDGPGVYTIGIQVSDGYGGSGYATSTWHVAEVNRPPVLPRSGTLAIDEETGWSMSLRASDYDSPTNQVRVVVTGLAEGMQYDSTYAYVWWTPTEAQGPATYSFTATATDNGSPPLSDTYTYTIAVREVNRLPELAAIADFRIVDGEELVVPLIASDPDLPANPLTYLLGGGPSGMHVDPLTGVLTWTPSASQAPGDYFVQAVVHDGWGSASRSFAVHVDIANRPPTLEAIADQTLDECADWTYALVARDDDRFANPFSYWVTGAPDGFAVDPGSGVMTWHPDEAQGPGDFVVTAWVSDNDTPAYTAQQTFGMHVREVNVLPVLSVVATVSVDEGALVQFVAQGSDVDLPANPLVYALLPPSPSDATIDGATGEVRWTPLDDGTATLRVQLDDGAGGLVTADCAVTVHNVAPLVALSAPPAGTVVPINTVVPLAGAFTDPSLLDTHTAVWTVGPYTVPATLDATTRTVDGSGSFPLPGVYAVSLAVTDDDGGVGYANTIDGLDAMLVVYDPNGGFVTGGGWCLSPAGAYPANPALSEKANMGFTAQYKKNATVPTGETEFQLKSAGLNFHSTSYDWLAVRGGWAQYAGHGTLNGGGSYAFTLTVIDGELADGGGDRIRMRIVEPASGVVVYDTQPGAIENADPTLVLGGGSVVIHPASTSSGKNKPLGDVVLPARFAVHALAAARPGVVVDLPVECALRVEAFDVAGRCVATLIDAPVAAGQRTVLWPARETAHAAQVTFCRVTATPRSGLDAPFTATARLVVVR